MQLSASLGIGLLLCVIGCDAPAPAATSAETTTAPPGEHFTLPALRRARRTRHRHRGDPTPPPAPPSDVFELVRYAAPLGDNVAYVTPVRPSPDGARRPGLIWLSGGFRWSLGAHMWTPGPPENDQSATAFLAPDLVLMRPALRGVNGNPGDVECFVGEVDDVLAAAEYLATRPDVDPARIYLGGHSTGGTLALLAAESSARFRAVVALGAAPDARGYGEPRCIPSDATTAEAELRAPALYLHEIRTPTVVAEGALGSWSRTYPALEAQRGTAPVTILSVPGLDHRTLVRPACLALLEAIRADTASDTTFSLRSEAILRHAAPPPAP
ncbi:MAG: prolyl oligopeptidase family serine peptidase [Myxococcales bacterium]|nr:prolyl oligopeptidase family serine peptidase [Myxococcales bacterium]